MKRAHTLLSIVAAAGLAACGQQGAGNEPAGDTSKPAQEQAMSEADSKAAESFEIVPGLAATILKKGYGRAAEAGDYVTVHYTGWFQDTAAADGRGDKFDSSVDRDETFNFSLGQGQVIQGWDKGIEGMLIGEKRQLTIAPALAYGERGHPAGIPPNSTLIFEVELFAAEGAADTASE